MERSEYLESRLEDQINWYERKSAINKKWYRRCKVAQFTIASLITLTGMFTSEHLQWVVYCVPVLGAIIAIISGVSGLYNFQDNWMEYRMAAEALKYEKFLFVTNSEPYHSPSSFKLFVNKVESIISKENAKWAELNKKVVSEGESENPEPENEVGTPEDESNPDNTEE